MKLPALSRSTASECFLSTPFKLPHIVITDDWWRALYEWSAHSRFFQSHSRPSDFDHSTYCVMYYKLGSNKTRLDSSKTQMGWLLRSSKEMGFCTRWTLMQWRPDWTRLRQDNQTRRVALRSRALVWQPSSQIKSSDWTDNCPTRVWPSPASAAHCGWYEKESRLVPDRQGAEGDIVVTHLAPTVLHYFTVWRSTNTWRDVFIVSDRFIITWRDIDLHWPSAHAFPLAKIIIKTFGIVSKWICIYTNKGEKCERAHEK